MGKRIKTNKTKTILWVEDDLLLISPLLDMFRHHGYEILPACTVADALQLLDKRSADIDLAILDVMLMPDKKLLELDTFDGKRTGKVLGRLIKEKYPKIKFIGFSVVADPEVADWFNTYGSGYFRKVQLPNEFLQSVEAILYPKRPKKKPRMFIVHGHDHQALYELKNYLQNVLRLGKPVILREQPSFGRTIIEKFEDESKNIDLVFVLLTPDDKISPKKASDTVKRRARQNVIFELGFFYSKLQRKSGQVLLLHKGQVELPSDISGLIYINIANGIESAGEEIRRELSAWL